MEPEGDYHIHKKPLLDPVPSKLNHIQTLTSCFLRNDFCVLIWSTLRCSECSHQFRFQTKILNAFLISPVRAICPTDIILLNLIVLITFGEEYELWSSSLYCLLQSSAPSSIFKFIYSPQHPVLKHSQCVFYSQYGDQGKHPYKTTGKNIVFYIQAVKWRKKIPNGSIPWI